MLTCSRDVDTTSFITRSVSCTYTGPTTTRLSSGSALSLQAPQSHYVDSGSYPSPHLKSVEAALPHDVALDLSCPTH
jgi:hypothetical protein